VLLLSDVKSALDRVPPQVIATHPRNLRVDVVGAGSSVRPAPRRRRSDGAKVRCRVQESAPRRFTPGHTVPHRASDDLFGLWEKSIKLGEGNIIEINFDVVDWIYLA
jgi:hypothetical protein